ncbi:AraC family transcriptional regulator [Lederbergia sp. NSJ-179]|uniref:helix-turn-helix domain-containing protein n=1 Tax=Lederbergia sp. NSJ-179 TaxID=2931402 RepID=UPI001FD3BE36|nr:AraC family transcriptional regulator [Lederbergia sp. NSJ-179]MCJ7843017.1 AraC family transcriptional regulator [Lederbergia sp. NSJ-179]
MEPEVLLCGYSYHKRTFEYNEFKQKGLKSYLIRLQTEGTALARAGDQTIKTEVGSLLLLPPGTIYWLRVERNEGNSNKRGHPIHIMSGDHYLFCQGPWIEQWWERYPKPLCVNIELQESLLTLWRTLTLENRRQDKDDELMSYLLRAVCLHLDRAIKETTPSYRLIYTASRMKRYIERHVSHPFTVEDVAKSVNLSASRAARLFKEYYGKTIMSYALETRLFGAVDRMKHTTMTLEEIAHHSGFRSYTHFHRVFKDRFGLPPSRFRNQ